MSDQSIPQEARIPINAPGDDLIKGYVPPPPPRLPAPVPNTDTGSPKPT